MKITIDTKQLARAFDKWMDHYTKNPEAFQREFESVQEFMRDSISKGITSYGRSCASYLLTKLSVKTQVRVTKKPSKKRRARVSKKAGRK